MCSTFNINSQHGRAVSEIWLKTSALTLTFKEQNTVVRFFSCRGPNHHEMFNPISLGHNRTLHKLSSRKRKRNKNKKEQNKPNCPAKLQNKNGTRGLHKEAAVGTKLLSAVNIYQRLPKEKKKESHLLLHA